jgi:DNA-binding CsgD family transcriptional regulator
LIAEGKGNREIAEVLGISVRTVEAHRARIMLKLDLESVPSLVRYAVRHGIIEA